MTHLGESGRQPKVHMPLGTKTLCGRKRAAVKVAMPGYRVTCGSCLANGSHPIRPRAFWQIGGGAS